MNREDRSKIVVEMFKKAVEEAKADYAKFEEKQQKDKKEPPKELEDVVMKFAEELRDVLDNLPAVMPSDVENLASKKSKETRAIMDKYVDTVSNILLAHTDFYTWEATTKAVELLQDILDTMMSQKLSEVLLAKFLGL